MHRLAFIWIGCALLACEEAPNPSLLPLPGADPGRSPSAEASAQSFVFAGFSKDGKRFAYTSGSASGSPMRFLWVTETGSLGAETLARIDPERATDIEHARKLLADGGFTPERRAPPPDLKMTAHLSDSPPAVTLSLESRTKTATIEKSPYSSTARAEIWGMSPDGQHMAIHIAGPGGAGELATTGRGRVEFYRVISMP